jgi:uncharacterized SAM-binding protein YcdF (DUF218 family)
VTAFVWYFFSVGGLVVFLLAATVWLRVRPQSANARRFLLLVAVFYTAASLYGISYGTGRLLVIGLGPLQRSDVPPGRTAIVLLGSGSFTVHDWDNTRFSIMDRPATSRVLEAVRVFRLVDADWIISSGGLVDPDDTDEPAGETMRDALVQLGVPPSAILVETKSRNTHDEAVIVASMLPSMEVDHVILVTSDIHMRRSLGAFRAQGIDAVPAIARFPDLDVPWALPSDDGLHAAAAVAHEILGLAYYSVRGWYRF